MRGLDTGQGVFCETLAAEPVHDFLRSAARNVLVLLGPGSLLSRDGVVDDRGRRLAMRMVDLRLADCGRSRLSLGADSWIQISR